jgi:hypothetical protein
VEVEVQVETQFDSSLSSRMKQARANREAHTTERFPLPTYGWIQVELRAVGATRTIHLHQTNQKRRKADEGGAMVDTQLDVLVEATVGFYDCEDPENPVEMEGMTWQRLAEASNPEGFNPQWNHRQCIIYLLGEERGGWPTLAAEYSAWAGDSLRDVGAEVTRDFAPTGS